MGRGPQKVDLTVAMGYHPPKAYICHEQNRFEAISQLRKDLTDLQLPMPKADSVRFLAGAAMGTVEFTWHEQLPTGTLFRHLSLKINKSQNIPTNDRLLELGIQWITFRVDSASEIVPIFTQPSIATYNPPPPSSLRSRLKREASPSPLPLYKRIKLESPPPSSASSFSSMHISTPTDTASAISTPPPPPLTAEQIAVKLQSLRKAMQSAGTKEQAYIQSLQDMSYPVPASLSSSASVDLQEERYKRAEAEERLEKTRAELRKAMGELTKERLNLLQTQRNASSSCDTLAQDLLEWQKEKMDLQNELVQLQESRTSDQARIGALEMEVERERRARREAIQERDRAYANFVREREARAEDVKGIEDSRVLKYKLDKIAVNLEKERKLRGDIQTELTKERRLCDDARDEVRRLKKAVENVEREQNDIRMECREPFVVPALFDMLKMLSRTTTESIDSLPIHVD